MIESQSVETAEAGWPGGYDAGREINGRKCQVLVDNRARALVLDRCPADIQDRDGEGPLLGDYRGTFPFGKKVFAGSGDKAAKAAGVVIKIFFAWIVRNRLLAKEFDATIDSARDFIYAAAVIRLVRHPARTR